NSPKSRESHRCNANSHTGLKEHAARPSGLSDSMRNGPARSLAPDGIHAPHGTLAERGNPDPMIEKQVVPGKTAQEQEQDRIPAGDATLGHHLEPRIGIDSGGRPDSPAVGQNHCHQHDEADRAEDTGLTHDLPPQVMSFALLTVVIPREVGPEIPDPDTSQGELRQSLPTHLQALLLKPSLRRLIRYLRSSTRIPECPESVLAFLRHYEPDGDEENDGHYQLPHLLEQSTTSKANQEKEGHGFQHPATAVRQDDGRHGHEQEGCQPPVEPPANTMGVLTTAPEEEEQGRKRERYTSGELVDHAISQVDPHHPGNPLMPVMTPVEILLQGLEHVQSPHEQPPCLYGQ